MWRMSTRWFVLFVGGIFTLLSLGPIAISASKHNGHFQRDLRIGLGMWVVCLIFVLVTSHFVHRQGVIAHDDRIWVRNGRRWHGPIRLDDVLAVQFTWARGVGSMLALINRKDGYEIRRRTAVAWLGQIRPGRYRDLHDGPVYFVLIPSWAMRGGHLLRMIGPALVSRPDVRMDKAARAYIIASSGLPKDSPVWRGEPDPYTGPNWLADARD